jgi:hypothetical protein
MSALDPTIFQQHSDSKLRVWFSDGVNGFQQLTPDRPFASVPYAFSAGNAPITQGSIDHSMLSNALRSDLNSSIKNITRDMLPDSVLSDLNRTITRDMLPPSVLADLNRTITKSNLGSDVLSDLNSSISLNRLSPEVLAALQVTPSISTEPFARYDWRTDTATIEARGRGHNLSYQWLKNGQVISGANAPVLELSNPVLDDNATYSVQLTNSVGQTTSQTITLQQAIGAPGLPLDEANATQVPRNGLVLWLDANDLNADGNEDSLVVGDRVASWTDQISKNKAEQNDLNNEPTKGISGIVFSRNHSLVIGDLNTSAKHILIVGKRKYRQGWSFLIKGKDINQVRWYHSQSDISGNGGTTEFTYGTGGSRRISGGFTSLPLDETFIVTLTKGNHSLDGGLFADLTIGLGLDGEISEILFYDRFLQNNERDAVERYLADKWDIQLHADKLAAEQAAYDAALPVNEPEVGLQAYYKFEPVSVEPDKLWDHSGSSRHLTLRNFSNNCWNEGISGQSLSFDGINDYANRTTDLNFNFQTVSFWVKPKTTVDGRNDPNPVFFALNPGNGNHGKSLFFNYSKLGGSGHWMLVNHSGDDSYLETNSTELSPLFGWFHLSFTATQSDGNPSYNFYVNGESVPNTSSATAIGFMNGGDTNTGLQIGRGRELGYFEGSLDEFKIYDRIFTPAEVESLFNSYQNPIVRTNGEHNATVGTNFSLSLASDNGPTTYLAEGLPTGLSLNVSTGQISGTVTQPGYHRVFVKAMNEHGTGSDTIAIVARPQTDQYGWPVDVPDGSAIPQNGLVLWLDANDVDADGEFDTNTDHLKLANWADKAGKDHNATQATVANQPEIRSGQISGKPNLNVLVFDGNQSLSFPTIAQGRTFFWVLRRGSDSDVSAQFFSEKNILSWGRNTYKYYFANAGNPTIYNGVCRRNGSVIVANTINAFHTEFQVLSLSTDDFVNSDLIGKNGNAENYFTGNFGEILVYDRTLSTSEIETVEQYLGSKWGISISHDTTPSPSGNSPTFTVTPANDSVTTAHLTEQILKYLKPEITSQPQGTMVPANGSTTLTASAEGKFLTYQWQKDGTDLIGETNATLIFSDFNGTQDDGNYTITVSNDFGSVISAPAEIKEQ